MQTQTDKQDTMEWFTKTDFSKYGHGNYVAIVGKKVVCSGADPETVYTKAKKLCPDNEIILWKIPKKDMMILR